MAHDTFPSSGSYTDQRIACAVTPVQSSPPTGEVSVTVGGTFTAVVNDHIVAPQPATGFPGFEASTREQSTCQVYTDP